MRTYVCTLYFYVLVYLYHVVHVYFDLVRFAGISEAEISVPLIRLSKKHIPKKSEAEISVAEFLTSRKYLMQELHFPNYSLAEIITALI